MNIIRRLFLFIGGLLLIFAGVFGIICLTDTSICRYTILYLQNIFFNSGYFWNVIGIAAIVIVLGLVSIYLSIAHVKKQGPLAQITMNEGGNVSISMPAIESVVKRAASKVAGVQDVKTQIKNVPESGGIAILLNISVPAESNIPEITNVLQEEVKNKTEAMTGLKVLEVKVLVASVGTPAN